MGGGLLSQAVLQEHSPEAEAPEVPARAFRVVCDNMLGGLGRTLRCLGVDVRVLHSGEDHRQAAEVSGPGGAGMFVAEAAPQLRAPHPEVGQGSPGCRVGLLLSGPAVYRLLWGGGLVRAGVRT